MALYFVNGEKLDENTGGDSSRLEKAKIKLNQKIFPNIPDSGIKSNEIDCQHKSHIEKGFVFKYSPYSVAGIVTGFGACERIQKRKCFDASSGLRGRGDVFSNEICNTEVIGSETLENIADLTVFNSEWEEQLLTGSIYGDPPNKFDHDYLFDNNDDNICNQNFPVTSASSENLYKRMDCECQAHASNAASNANIDKNSSDVFGILDYVHTHNGIKFDEKCFVKKHLN